MAMEKDRLEFLLNRYFDHALGLEEKQELEQALLESAGARETFWQRSQWHGAIRQWAEEEGGRREMVEGFPAVATPRVQPRVLPRPRRAPVATSRRSRSVRRSSRVFGWWLSLAAAVVLVLGFLAWPLLHPPGQMALLTHTASVVWAEGASAYQAGAALRGGTLQLKSGALEIEFSRGARLVLEGPAEFELLSTNSGALRRGKLVATVPESAHGFTVQTPGFLVTDYGTQFGCNVPPNAPAEVHVFRGSVGVETAANVLTRLHENQAIRVANTQVEDIPARPDAFVTEEKLAHFAEIRALDDWRQSSRAMSQRPGMLVYYDFERDGQEAASRTLVNRAPNASPDTNGTIEGCVWADGRWPGKGALKFDGEDQRVRLTLPGEYPAMTFVAFVQVARTPFLENSLIRAEGQNQLGGVQWYISREGALTWSARVAPRGAASQWLRIFSAPVFRGQALDSWHMVATVYDGKTITHYLDGKVIGIHSDRVPTAITLARLVVGNGHSTLVPRTPNEGATNFSGRIDELAILSVPLSSEDIQRWYAQGHSGQD